jgi:hypothetical protein
MHTGAYLHYVANIRAAFRLSEPMFYTKDAWIALCNDQQSIAETSNSYSDVQYSAVPQHSSSAAAY